MPFILYEKGQKLVFSSSSPGENREKKDEDLVGGQRNVGVKITVYQEAAEGLPAQQEPA